VKTTAYQRLPRGSTAKGQTAPTPRQAAVLRFVGDFFAANLRPPTYREVCGFMGSVSTNGAEVMLAGLARKGMLRRVPRGYVITRAVGEADRPGDHPRRGTHHRGGAVTAPDPAAIAADLRRVETRAELAALVALCALLVRRGLVTEDRIQEATDAAWAADARLPRPKE
jgi:hypothetical protein